MSDGRADCFLFEVAPLRANDYHSRSSSASRPFVSRNGDRKLRRGKTMSKIKSSRNIFCLVCLPRNFPPISKALKSDMTQSHLLFCRGTALAGVRALPDGGQRDHEPRRPGRHGRDAPQHLLRRGRLAGHAAQGPGDQQPHHHQHEDQDGG